jgi:hypothetical protein
LTVPTGKVAFSDENWFFPEGGGLKLDEKKCEKSEFFRVKRLTAPSTPK